MEIVELNFQRLSAYANHVPVDQQSSQFRAIESFTQFTGMAKRSSIPHLVAKSLASGSNTAYLKR